MTKAVTTNKMNIRITGALFTILLLTPLTIPTAAAVGSASRGQPDPIRTNADGWVFASFRGNGEDGLHLAWSRDGLRWTAFRNDGSFLKPEVGGKLMRDPCIIQGPDGVFHMAWTSSWGGGGIGIAHSSDLINWSRQEFVPVMEHEKTARNCWAPEITWDPDGGEYVIYWATTIPGRFTKTEVGSEKGWNHRIYCTTTKDFKTYTDTRLFCDPGFDSIDATIVKAAGSWVMVLKDETLNPPAKNLRIATSAKVSGPWSAAAPPFTPAGLWVEGPTCARIDDAWYVYFDKYRNGGYGAMKTRDFKSWEDVTAQLVYPKGLRHGTVVAVTGDILDSLLKLDAESRAFHPGETWPDNHGVHINAHGAGILHHDGTYYWFGEHKIEGGAGNVAHVGVHVYSSKDLFNWTDEGIALKVSDDPRSEIVKGCVIERPKVIYNKKTSTFVMWFHLELLGQGYRAARSGVAVADKVTGPYRYLGSFRPDAGVWPENVAAELKKPLTPAETEALAKVNMPGDFVPKFGTDMIFRRDFAGGQMARDMTLFVDDDGRAYHIFASEENSTLHISLLSDDYLKPAGKYIRVFVGAFNEAPALFKRGGKYFLITSGCTSWAPNAARLAVADSIWGPWTALGNPWRGAEEKTRISFDSQSTFVLPVAGKQDAFIFLADRWRPDNAIDGRYVWVPVQFDRSGRPFLEWKDKWDLGVFDQPQ